MSESVSPQEWREEVTTAAEASGFTVEVINSSSLKLSNADFFNFDDVFSSLSENHKNSLYCLHRPDSIHVCCTDTVTSHVIERFTSEDIEMLMTFCEGVLDSGMYENIEYNISDGILEIYTNSNYFSADEESPEIDHLVSKGSIPVQLQSFGYSNTDKEFVYKFITDRGLENSIFGGLLSHLLIFSEDFLFECPLCGTQAVYTSPTQHRLFTCNNCYTPIPKIERVDERVSRGDSVPEIRSKVVDLLKEGANINDSSYFPSITDRQIFEEGNVEFNSLPNHEKTFLAVVDGLGLKYEIEEEEPFRAVEHSNWTCLFCDSDYTGPALDGAHIGEWGDSGWACPLCENCREYAKEEIQEAIANSSDDMVATLM